jgi:uncharacterized protein YbjT (DUF2867 family)
MGARNDKLAVILTGATGMVGEGVLLACLEHPDVARVTMVNRRHYDLAHPKLREILVSDFLDLAGVESELAGYDACLYCAGISSRGMSEADYTRVTYEVPLHFAGTLARLNPGMALCHVSGASTDGTEKGKIMWARVKGRAENALVKLPFRGVYNFRPGFMKAGAAQRNVKGFYRAIGGLYPVLKALFPRHVCTTHDVGMAMINAARIGYSKQVLEVADILLLSAS